MPYQRPAHRGDYPRVGNTLQLMAERLVEAADVHAGQRVLDVACGQGNALASWTPEGLIGALFRTIGKYAPPPAGVKSPMLWGTEARLADLFGDTAGRIRGSRRRAALITTLADRGRRG